jgi:phage/plasmid-associated DNA primase
MGAEILQDLGFVVMSGNMSASLNKNGEWKKQFTFRKNWETLTKSDVRVGENALAIVCGKTSGCSVIDIDDPTTEHNQKLMQLMAECNMVQKTSKGYHYFFNYNPKLKNTQGDKLDIRNDGGCIFTSPSIAYDNDGNAIAYYEWTKLADNQLIDVPPSVIDYLSNIGGSRYVITDQPVNTPTHTPATVEVREDKPSLLLKVLHALPTKFVDFYADWITMGMILFNEKHTVQDWIELSKKSDKYDGSCEMHWNTFKSSHRGVSGATAWKWLKETNRAEFWNLMEERNDFWDLIGLLNNVGSARYFYNIHPNNYLYNETLGWFSLEANNIWKQYKTGQPSKLKRHLADTLQELAMDTKKAELARYAKISENEKDKKKQEEQTIVHAGKIKAIHNAFIKFGSSEFCNGILTFLSSFYNDDALEDKMDKNGRVFAFSDGLYDLETLCFRPITPKDYISVTTGYEFPVKSDAHVKSELDKFFYTLFENNDTTQYLLSVLCSCLFGGNRFQEFYVFTGAGGNGKSLISILMKAVFGQYFLSVDCSLLTKPVERRDQPVPVLVEAKTCRLMLSSEPEASDKLQVGLLKKMSGGDVIEARTLNSSKIVKYVAMFKLIVLANDIPALNKLDGGVQRRMKVCKFPFAFKPKHEMTEPFHREADPDLELKMSSNAFRNEMILLLIEKYKEVRHLKASPTCSAVQEQSKEYLDENNPLKEWLNEYYTMGGENHISARELKNQYLSDTGAEGIDDRKFSQLLGFNGITKKRMNGGMHYVGITRTNKEE